MTPRHPELVDQAGFKRREREERNASILHAAAVNPSLSLGDLAERFRMKRDAIRNVLGKAECARRAAAQLRKGDCTKAKAPTWGNW